MDIQELNDDRKMISGANKLNNIIDRGFSDRAKSLVTNHSIIGGIALALPLFGFDNIVYLIVLWHMYYGLCDLANKSFGSNKTKSFVGAVIVNLIVATALELVCNVVPVVGSIVGGFIIVFASIKISGAAYLKALEIAHDGNVAERYTFDNTKKLY